MPALKVKGEAAFRASDRRNVSLLAEDARGFYA